MKNKTKNLVTLLIFFVVSSVVSAQILGYGEWETAGKPVLPVGSANTIIAPLGTLTTYPDLASFQTAAASAVYEDFNGGLVAAAGVAVCTPPVNSVSNDVCFAPGNLIAGFNLDVSTLGNDAVALGDGFIGNATVVVGAVSFADDTIVTFDSPVDAVTFDVTTNGANPITITVLDAGSATIGTINTAVTAQGALTFVGFSSLTPIASLIISDDTGGGELIDNLGFGSLAPLAPPAPIPALSTINLIILFMFLLAIAKFSMRRYS